MDATPHEDPESLTKHGWIELRGCLLSSIVLPRVLLHSRFGIVVIGGPPEAVAVLRQRLDQARFSAIFPGTLPVVQLVGHLPRTVPSQRDTATR
jgi:hypothetical protein